MYFKDWAQLVFIVGIKMTKNFVMTKRLLCCVLVIIASIGITANAQSNLPSKQEVRELLERWCVLYYDKCFVKRTYIKKSLRVTSVDEDESTGYLMVRGKHSYHGNPNRLGGQKSYPDVDFKATIMPSDDGRGILVRFLKWTIPYLPLQTGWWDTGEGIIYLN